MAKTTLYIDGVPTKLIFDGVPIKPVYLEVFEDTIHMADKVNKAGEVSALCFKSPRAIDLDQASWTTNIDGVSCKRCIAKFACKQKK